MVKIQPSSKELGVYWLFTSLSSLSSLSWSCTALWTFQSRNLIWVIFKPTASAMTQLLQIFNLSMMNWESRRRMEDSYTTLFKAARYLQFYPFHCRRPFSLSLYIYIGSIGNQLHIFCIWDSIPPTPYHSLNAIGSRGPIRNVLCASGMTSLWLTCFSNERKLLVLKRMCGIQCNKDSWPQVLSHIMTSGMPLVQTSLLRSSSSQASYIMFGAHYGFLTLAGVETLLKLSPAAYTQLWIHYLQGLASPRCCIDASCILQVKMR